jgi:hypothetical protein
LNPSLVEVVDAIPDLLAPGSFHILIVRERVETIDQSSSKVAALLIRQTQRLFEKMRSLM